MMYTLDLSGHDEDGRPGIDRLGGLFRSIDDALTHGRSAAARGRFPFKPKTVWVRDQEGNVVRQDAVAA